MTSIKTVIEAVNFDLYRLQQGFKWVVYILLSINFCLYLYEDIRNAHHVIPESHTIFHYLRAYTTSMDFAAWMIIIVLFELETYVLSEDVFTGRVKQLVYIVRLLCVLFVIHTAFSYATSLAIHYDIDKLDDTSDLCQLVGSNESFVRNIDYWTITAENCATLSNDNTFYRIRAEQTVTDRDGLQLERVWAWQDMLEVSAWLLIILLMELEVRVLGKGETGDRGVINYRTGKFVLYTLLLCMAVHWGVFGHVLYLWDELLWVLGFLVIEMNVKEWRTEVQADVS